VALLRAQDYSISDLLRDVRAAKARAGAQHAALLDDVLAACINQTSAIHEAAVENMQHGFCELTADGCVLYANPALLSLLPGCEGQELAAHFPGNPDGVRAALAGRAAGQVHRFDLEAGGQLRPVLAEFGPVRGGATAYGLITDLTHAQDAERRTHDTAPFAILKLDPQHRITYANEAAGRLLGGTPQDMVGRDAGSLVRRPKDVEVLEREYEKRRQGETSEYELEIQPINSDAPARVVVRSIPEGDPGGAIASTLVTLSPMAAELAAQGILDDVAQETGGERLFGRLLDRLRPLVPFDTAILLIYNKRRTSSRILFSKPAAGANELWIPIPEAFRSIVDGPKPYGDLRGTLLATEGGQDCPSRAPSRSCSGASSTGGTPCRSGTVTRMRC